MRKARTGRRLAQLRARRGWLVSGVFAAAIMANQASAKEVTEKVAAFSPGSFERHSETWASSWKGGISNLATGFTILITMRPDIIVGQDRHTFAFSTSLLPNATYAVSSGVVVKNTNSGAVKDAAELVRSADGTAITTVLTNVPFSLTLTSPLTSSSGTLTLDNAVDTTKTGSGSDISRFSNSIFEELPVPEPNTIMLMGTGVLALAGATRRRSSS